MSSLVRQKFMIQYELLQLSEGVLLINTVNSNSANNSKMLLAEVNDIYVRR